MVDKYMWFVGKQATGALISHKLRDLVIPRWRTKKKQPSGQGNSSSTTRNAQRRRTESNPRSASAATRAAMWPTMLTRGGAVGGQAPQTQPASTAPGEGSGPAPQAAPGKQGKALQSTSRRLRMALRLTNAADSSAI
eukprot:GHVN01076164.1.p1 GENE.GHVN01076164.1~~GHVN01076164.1.p1  ORF type:complete len:137 (+),score=22.52 GHVN01076164.1:544-954(+)